MTAVLNFGKKIVKFVLQIVKECEPDHASVSILVTDALAVYVFVVRCE